MNPSDEFLAISIPFYKAVVAQSDNVLSLSEVSFKNSLLFFSFCSFNAVLASFPIILQSK